MMGERRVMQEALFYGFSLERHVPDNHVLRRIDRFVDLSDLRAHLGPYYSDVGRPRLARLQATLPENPAVDEKRAKAAADVAGFILAAHKASGWLK